MSDDERMQRLTEIARRVWPNEDASVVSTGRGAGVFQPGLDGHACALILAHPRALDALEAALLVLLDQPIPTDAHDRFVGGGARPAYDAKGGERG